MLNTCAVLLKRLIFVTEAKDKRIKNIKTNIMKTRKVTINGKKITLEVIPTVNGSTLYRLGDTIILKSVNCWRIGESEDATCESENYKTLREATAAAILEEETVEEYRARLEKETEAHNAKLDAELAAYLAKNKDENDRKDKIVSDMNEEVKRIEENETWYVVVEVEDGKSTPLTKATLSHSDAAKECESLKWAVQDGKWKDIEVAYLYPEKAANSHQFLEDLKYCSSVYVWLRKGNRIEGCKNKIIKLSESTKIIYHMQDSISSHSNGIYDMIVSNNLDNKKGYYPHLNY